MQPSLFSAISIPIGHGESTIIDLCDADLASLKWYVTSKSDRCTVQYAVRRVQLRGKRVYCRLHRIILERMIGRPLTPKEQVDHIDGNGLNNQRANLRLASGAQNRRNIGKRRNNTSGYKGVWFDRSVGKWQTQIVIDSKKKHLGHFDNPEDAYAVYCAAAEKYHGEFARTA